MGPGGVRRSFSPCPKVLEVHGSAALTASRTPQGFVVAAHIAQEDGFPLGFEGDPQRADASGAAGFPDALRTSDALHAETRVPQVLTHPGQRFLNLLLILKGESCVGSLEASRQKQPHQALPASSAARRASTSLNGRTRPWTNSSLASRSACCQASLQK